MEVYFRSLCKILGLSILLFISILILIQFQITPVVFIVSLFFTFIIPLTISTIRENIPIKQLLFLSIACSTYFTIDFTSNMTESDKNLSVIELLEKVKL